MWEDRRSPWVKKNFEFELSCNIPTANCTFPVEIQFNLHGDALKERMHREREFEFEFEVLKARLDSGCRKDVNAFKI